MLNTGKLAAGGGEYHLEIVASSVEVGAGEAPGTGPYRFLIGGVGSASISASDL